MGMALKDVLRLIAPPVLIQLAKRLRGHQKDGAYGLFGDYASWGEAEAASEGYDSQVILEKTRAALLKVKNGEAVYERDSVLFGEVQYAWPLLAGLMWVAAQSGGRLNVLDFGGSLGSTYFQNRAFLRSLREVRWNIVEQPRLVEIGRQSFEDGQLRFYLSIEECLAEADPNVVIASSVLQYLERPYDTLRKLLGLSCRHLIIDRTPFWDGPTDRLCVQRVPRDIYPASYPAWIFSRSRFRAVVDEMCETIAEFESADRLRGPVLFRYCGMLLVRRAAK